MVYHPTMNQAQSVIKEKKYHWHQFYLAPEQLQNLELEATNSAVFSLGVLILNIMNPLDFQRDIYSRRAYEVNREILDEKLTNAARIYSLQIMGLIRKMLIVDFEERLSLEEVIHLVEEINPFRKKSMMTSSIRNIVNSAMLKHRERSPGQEGKRGALRNKSS